MTAAPAAKRGRGQPAPAPMDPEGVLTVERIAPELLGLIQRVDTLREYPRNPNEGRPDAIAESLEEFSQYTPIVCQASTRFVVKGNHTLKAARALGWRYIACNVMELSDQQAMAIVVGDNRHSELSRRDPAILADLLTELQETSLLAGTGYSDDDVDDLLASLQEEAAAAPHQVEFTAYDESIADGLVLRGRCVVECPLDAMPDLIAALDDLKASAIPALAWKESETV